MLSINVKYFTKEASLEKAIETIKQSGFDALDYTPDLKNEVWEKEMSDTMSLIEKHGLSVHQTHAPFNRYGRWEGIHFAAVENCLKATSSMGAKYMVVHGDEFRFKEEEYTPEKALEYNYRYFYPIVEKAQESNIKIAFENVFEDNVTKPRFCSKTEEIKVLIEKFNTDTVCCCWDTGHAGVAFGEEQPQKILEMGKYIECTHIHDCGHGKDLHLPPHLGNINWDLCMDAFSKIGYNGAINYEMVYGSIPENLMQSFLDYLKKCADEFAIN